MASRGARQGASNVVSEGSGPLAGHFGLVDVETGNMVGSFRSEREALLAVAATARDYGANSDVVRSLSLFRDDMPPEEGFIADGEELVKRAVSVEAGTAAERPPQRQSHGGPAAGKKRNGRGLGLTALRFADALRAAGATITDDSLEKLKGAGVASTDDLLRVGGTAKGRQELAAKTGLRGESLLTWVNHADLYRLTGVGAEFSELLEAAGVDSVPELARRNAASLHQRMTEVNAQKKLTRRVPTEEMLSGWIAEAKTLPRAVEH